MIDRDLFPVHRIGDHDISDLFDADASRIRCLARRHRLFFRRAFVRSLKQHLAGIGIEARPLQQRC